MMAEDLAGAGPRMAESTKVRAHRAGSVVWPWVVGGRCARTFSDSAILGPKSKETRNSEIFHHRDDHPAGTAPQN